MLKRNPLDGLPAYLYRRSPFWYWKRFMFANPGQLAFGGRYYGSDFWLILNRGWHDMGHLPET